MTTDGTDSGAPVNEWKLTITAAADVVHGDTARCDDKCSDLCGKKEKS